MCTPTLSTRFLLARYLAPMRIDLSGTTWVCVRRYLWHVGDGTRKGMPPQVALEAI